MHSRARPAFEHRLATVITVDGVYDQGQTVRDAAGDVPGLERRLRAGADPETRCPAGPAMQARPVMRWAMEQAQHASACRPAAGLRRLSGLHLRDGSRRRSPAALICDAASGLFFAGQPGSCSTPDLPKTFLEFTRTKARRALPAGAERWPWPGSATG